MTAVPNAPSPGVALILGFIPGVGAMYNGQFLKAFIHVVIFTVLVMAANRIDAFGLLVVFWIFYMAFEAYKTAQAKMLGQAAPDLLGIDRLFGIQEESRPAPPPFAVSAAAGSTPESTVAPAMSSPPPEGQPPAAHAHAPAGAILLIVLGVLFLLANMGYLPSMDRSWPLILIGLGLWIAYRHMRLGA
ncbi:MAG TPA: DUF5668 domain-containing protein [Candidatus Angelobacter sp.]|nr:DUF5668 domain-containing protein [Candidatus Angelobacter sp.]